MRTVLVNLPWFEDNRLGVRSGSRWPFTALPEADGKLHYIPFPFFLAYAAAFMKSRGKEAKLIDAIAERISEEECIRKIADFDPALAVVEVSTPSFKNDLSLVRKILRKAPSVQIALCGTHASTFARQILDEYDFIDYVLIAEYEMALVELVTCLERGCDPKNVGGLGLRSASGIIINEPSLDIEIDALPWPERLDVPIYNYNDGFAGLAVPNVQMWSSRGCPFCCSFCLWPQVIYRNKGYRKRNPVDVVDEMEYLLNKFDFKAVYFDDDVFNVDRRHVLDICAQIKNRGIKVPWAVMARADLMDEELLDNMSEAGLYAIKYGIESADKGILSLCRKNLDLDKATSMIKATKRSGVKVHLTFCLGLPGENKDTLKATVGYIKDVHPDSVQFSFATPFPGTQYFNYLRAKKEQLPCEWQDYDGNSKPKAYNDDLTIKDLEGIKNAFSSNFDL